MVREKYFLPVPPKSLIKSEVTVKELNRTILYPQLMTLLKTLHVPAGNKIINRKILADGSILYDQEYFFDGAGLRNPLEGLRHRQVDSHLILMGCSVIFGEGLHENDTLRYYLQKQLPEVAVYNFGISGAGPHDLAEFLSIIPLKDYVTQSTGSLIYFYWDDHLRRAALHPTYLVWAGGERAYYDFETDHKLPSLIGRTKESAHWDKLEIAKKALLVRTYLEMSFVEPIDFREQDEKLIVGLTVLAKKSYLKNFPSGKFYFSFYPFFEIDRRHRRRLTTLLKQNEIEILEDPKIVNDDKLFIPYDGHPSAFGNQLLAEKLANLKQIRRKSDKN